jgi:hypothetical protein
VLPLFLVGLVVGTLTTFWILPVSREIVLKLGALIDMAKRSNPELFAQRLEPVNPFVGQKFKHPRMGRVLKADLSEFGELCVRLQREVKKLDLKVHLRMLPAGLYGLGTGIWYFTQG